MSILVSVVLLTGCNSDQPITIRLAGEKWFLNTLTETSKINEFEKKTGIKVDIIHESDQVLLKNLKIPPKPGKPPYDLIVIRQQFLGDLVAAGEIQPITPFLEDPIRHGSRFKPQQRLFSNLWHEISWYKGQAYGYPYTFLTTVLCWRKDLLGNPKEQTLFKARYHRYLKPPTTWKEYTDLAEFFTRPSEHLYGTYIQGQQHVALWYEWLNFSYSFGGNILDAEHGDQIGDIVLNAPQNVAATEQYLKLIRFSPPETLNYNWNDALTTLQQGRAFIGLLWSDQIPLLESPSVSKVAGKIGYSLIPSATGRPFSQLEGLTYLIPSRAIHPREAYRFMEWAMSPDVQIAQTLDGGGSTLRATYKNPRVRRLPYIPAVLASIPVAIPKPTIPQSPEITSVMVQGLRDVVTRKCSPQQGLDAMALKIQHVLAMKARLLFGVKTRGCLATENIKH